MRFYSVQAGIGLLLALMAGPSISHAETVSNVIIEQDVAFYVNLDVYFSGRINKARGCRLLIANFDTTVDSTNFSLDMRCNATKFLLRQCFVRGTPPTFYISVKPQGTVTQATCKAIRKQ